MNKNVIVITKKEQVLLNNFPQYQPIKGDQFHGAVTVASANPAKFIVSVDDDVVMSEETFTSIYDKSSLRAGWIDSTLTIRSLELIRQELISLQTKYINNDIDIIILTYGYNELFADVKNADIIKQTGDLVRLWKKQTKQLMGFDIPVVIQIKRRVSLLSTEEEQKIDRLLLTHLSHE